MGLTVIIGTVFREIVKRVHNEGWSRNTVGLYLRFTELFQTFQWFHSKYMFEHLTLFPWFIRKFSIENCGRFLVNY